MALSVQDLTALHARGSRAIRFRLLEALRRIWRALAGYRDDDADRLVAMAVPLVAAAQQQVAALTDVYLASVLSVQQGRPVAPLGLPSDRVTGRAVRAVDPTEEYRRPIVEARTALSQGKSLDEAARAGERRLKVLAATDLQLAKTHVARAALERDGTPEFYRRTLTGAENCGLCIVATTQRYRKAQLLPIHPGCDCGVMTVPAAEAPEQVLDPELLEAAHNAIAERFGQQFADRGAREPLDYRKVLLVREHSELGPVLTVASHRFTGVNDLEAT